MIENKKVIACYIRLSEDDEDTGKGLKDESNSVTSQRKLIRAYIDREDEFSGYGIKEYVDDGFTGTDFNRPGYKRLIEEAKSGNIGIIIVKDFSRLGRDHLETGDLLERIFPLLGIRFISVNDYYDSADCNGMTGGLSVALKNVMNAMYSRDLSGKVRSAMTTRAKNGQYMAAKVPYGYRKDPEDVHHLIIDEDAAQTVRLIFKLASEDKGKKWIAGYLNKNGILTPGEYIERNGMSCGGSRNTEHPKWTVTSLSDMLRNQVYIGNTCWNKSVQNLSTGKKMVRKSRDQWIVSEGTHEPLVSKELFDLANKKAFTGEHKQVMGKVCPLVYCACCGRSMAAPKDGNHIRYRCMNGYGEFAEENCKKSRIKSSDLEQAVLANVNMMADMYAEDKKKLKAKASETFALEDIIAKLTAEKARLTSKKSRLYEEYRTGGTREEYIRKKQQNEERLASVIAEIQETECKLEAVKQNEAAVSATEKAFETVRCMTTFDREKLKLLIEKVVVYSEDQIEIVWKPMDAIFKKVTSGKTEVKI